MMVMVVLMMMRMLIMMVVLMMMMRMMIIMMMMISKRLKKSRIRASFLNILSISNSRFRMFGKQTGKFEIQSSLM